MPIKFKLTEKQLADLVSMSVDDVRRMVDEGVGEYVYKHMNNGSGICAECAPWLNMQTTGDGADGIPVPPLHPRCKCFLMPVAAAVFSDLIRGRFLRFDQIAWAAHFDWLRKLSPQKMSAILGVVRTRLVQTGEVTIEELYNGQYLKPLDELGYDRKGFKLSDIREVEELLKNYEIATMLMDFHEDHWRSLPISLRGSGPGDPVAIRRMTTRALRYVDTDVQLSRPGWLVILVALLRALLHPDESEPV